jgi:tetrahydromethanopterin S-methyltransferase subunit G
MEVSALNSLSASNLIHVIDTGFYALGTASSYDFDIQVTYLDDQVTNELFWAMNDFSVTAKRCQDCVTSHIKSLGRKIGIAIGITLGVLFCLVFILYMSILY